MKLTTHIATTPELGAPDRIVFLDNLRALAIIMVVGVHTLGYCIPLPDNQKAIVTFIVHTISVPTFFLVDGYLFARKITLSNQYDYIETIKTSAIRLLIPWIIFTLFYVAARYCFEFSGYLKDLLVKNHSFHQVLISSYGSVIAPHMYFLVSLFLIRSIGPVFKKISLIENNFILLFVFIIYFILYKIGINTIGQFLKIEGGQEPILHSIWGIQYYLTGIIIFKLRNIINYNKTIIFSAFLLVVTIIFKNKFDHLWFTVAQYLYLIGIFYIFSCLNNKKTAIVESIGKNTMGIYLIHSPIILKGVAIVINKIILIPILNFTSILLTTFFISFFLVLSIKRVPCGSVLFGEFPYDNTQAATSKNKQN